MDIRGDKIGTIRVVISDVKSDKNARAASEGRVKSRETCGCFALLATTHDVNGCLDSVQWTQFGT